MHNLSNKITHVPADRGNTSPDRDEWTRNGVPDTGNVAAEGDDIGCDGGEESRAVAHEPGDAEKEAEAERGEECNTDAEHGACEQGSEDGPAQCRVW